jgi:hypothetical protein
VQIFVVHKSAKMFIEEAPQRDGARPSKFSAENYASSERNILALDTAAETASRFWTIGRRDFTQNSFTFYFSVRVLFVCVFVNMFYNWFSVWTFLFYFFCRFCFRCENLVAAVHTSFFINTVRQTEIAAFFIFHDSHILERVVRPAITGVPARITHSN